LQKLKEEIEREKKAKSQAEVDKKKQAAKEFEARYRSALKGNQINQGTSTDGDLETVRDAYVGHIVERVRSNWSLPTYLRTQGLRASVIIYIDERGRIYRHVFRQSSGNEQFDDFIRTTLARSSPLAPPPSELAERLKQSGMELLFPL
jgi:outer membrane biosynthesis protein TonB